MPDPEQLRTWLRDNVGLLRTAPDMVTETAGPSVRFRWHDLVELHGQRFGLGIDLHAGPSLGEMWLYGHGVSDVRIFPHRVPTVPHQVRALLRTILVAHVADRERDWGRGAFLFGSSERMEASA